MKEIMKARKRDTPEKPPATLDPRPGDHDLPPQLYLVCKVFAQVGKKPSTDKFPGTLLLRRYDPGEVICWQGDTGWTAFAILTSDDLGKMEKEREKMLAEWPAKIQKATETGKTEDAEKFQEQLGRLQQAQMPEPLGGDPGRPAATVYLDTTRAAVPRPRGFWSRLFGGGSRQAPATRSPKYIAVDAPTTVDYGTRKATLAEGTLFGQWSCIYGTPRSATIVAERPIYVLEMLRNVLDTILGDAKFQEETDREYVQSILQNHLAGLSFFRELTPEQLAEVRAAVKLRRFHDGEIIFDRGDRSDSMYVVRRGLVKVLLNDWPLLAVEDVLNWPALAALAAPASDPVRYLGGKLDAGTRDLLGRAKWTEEEKQQAVEGLNELLKDSRLTTVENVKLKKFDPAPELKEVFEQPGSKEARAAEFPRDDKDWSDQEWRRYNRLVLETACPGALRTVRRLVGRDNVLLSGSENILTYHAQGEFFGEMGVMLSQPRSATCVAYVHPRPEGTEVDPQGDRWRRDEERVELVEIPGDLLRTLCQKYPHIKAQVDVEIALRQKRSAQRSARNAGGAEPPRQSDRFQQLGLIQGQKLMLIDLDRCTRCDECVQACVATHTDGRTRLFLDGPRFGKYLVPTSCRACRDPVCLIGCPVGSIRRGDNLGIVIEDWCIGCQLCAKNCPYGSIQMHDLGLVGEQAHGWKFGFREAVTGDSWTRVGFDDRSWQPTSTPFWWDASVEVMMAVERKKPVDDPPTLCFRREFQLPVEVLTLEDRGVKVAIDSAAREILVEGTGRQAKVKAFPPLWLNGQPIAAERWKFDRDQYVLELTGEERKILNGGRNVLALQVTPVPGKRGVLMQLAVDEIRASGAVIPLRAVVCDQCGSLPDQTAACVHACPHDAAMRVDAWTGFPEG